MKDIILFGMPWSGKGTQAEKIIESHDETIAHMSMWDIYRALWSKTNAIGSYSTRVMNAGKLVDDKVTISLFNAYFHSVLDEWKYMLLDGYPRTIPQVEAFLDLSKEHDRDIMWIFFELSEDEALQRMMSRAREDEDEEMMSIRLQEYYNKTHPVVERFAESATLVTIDASKSIEDIAVEVSSHIGW